MASFYAIIGHLHTFGEMSIQALCPFFNWVVILLLSFILTRESHQYFPSNVFLKCIDSYIFKYKWAPTF